MGLNQPTSRSFCDGFGKQLVTERGLNCKKGGPVHELLGQKFKQGGMGIQNLKTSAEGSL